MQTVDSVTIHNHHVGVTRFGRGGQLNATVTNQTNNAITSVATVTVSQTVDGYSLQCFDSTNLVLAVLLGDIKLSIPGKLLVETNTS